MNIFSKFQRLFINTLADYSMLNDIGRRIADVESIIASTDSDKNLYQLFMREPASRVSTLTQLYEQFITHRNDINLYEPFKTNYFVMAMIDTLSNDILAIDPRTNKTFDILVDSSFPSSKRCNRILFDFRESTQLDTYVSKLLFDGVFYGKYFVEYVYNSEGQIIGLKDSLQPGSVFTITLEGLNTNPLYYKLSTESQNKIDILDSNKIACLDFSSDRYRISMSKMTVSLQSKDSIISQTSSLGRPFCFDIYDQLISLTMLEQLELAALNSSLQRNSLVSVTAPDGLDLNQLEEFTAWYEKIVNSNGDSIQPNTYNLDMIKLFATEATKLRVVPTQTTRGSISASLSASENPVVNGLSDRIDKLRSFILDIKGIPPEFIFTGTVSTKVGESLRKYARYSRYVKKYQAALQLFLTTVSNAVLESYGYSDVKPYIIVNQYCAINSSELDRLEYADASASVIQNVSNVIRNLINDELITPYVDKKAYAQYVESLLDGLAGATQIINTGKKV